MGLQEQYGREETLGFFGECQASADSIIFRMPRKGVNEDLHMRNFSLGYISVVEMEHHCCCYLKDSLCRKDYRKGFAKHFAESDVEDLTKTNTEIHRTIARPNSTS